MILNITLNTDLESAEPVVAKAERLVSSVIESIKPDLKGLAADRRIQSLFCGKLCDILRDMLWYISSDSDNSDALAFARASVSVEIVSPASDFDWTVDVYIGPACVQYRVTVT